MEIVHPEFRPDPDLSQTEMKHLQQEIANKAVFSDKSNFVKSWGENRMSPTTCIEPIIAGIDQGFTDNKAVSGILAFKDGELIERQKGIKSLEIAYIPGLLAFREGGAIIEGLTSLRCEPDILLFDGNGRIHFREAGIATHIGVMFDVPTIGIAKNLLCGTPQQPIEKPLPQGTRIPITANDTVTATTDTTIGYVFQSKQYQQTENRYINPIYISPGHKVSAKTALEIVEANCSDWKLPDPINQADSYVSDIQPSKN